MPRLQSRETFTSLLESNKSQHADCCLHVPLFCPSGVPVLKGESRVWLMTGLVLEVYVRVCLIGTFQFPKYCYESSEILNPTNRPMLNTVSCVKLCFQHAGGSHKMLSLNSNMLCNKSLTLQFQGIHWTQCDLLEYNGKMALECAFDVIQKLAWHQGARVFDSRFSKKNCIMVFIVIQFLDI